MEKQCKGCGETKPFRDFYKQHHARDCRMGKCKECVKAAVRQNRLVNLEYYQEYDRKRANNPERVAARSAYQQSERGKQALRKAKKNYSQKPDRRRCHVALGNALRDGKVKKLDACEYCGSTNRVQAHHPSYAPGMELCVTWLCAPCHSRLHKEHREYERKKKRAA